MPVCGARSNHKYKQMNFQDYQSKTAETAIYPGKGELVGLTYTAIGIGDEAGEVLGKVKKLYRDDNMTLTEERRQALKAELGDVMWYISQCATELGLSLEEIAEANIEKLFARRDKGTLHGDGDNR